MLPFLLCPLRFFVGCLSLVTVSAHVEQLLLSLCLWLFSRRPVVEYYSLPLFALGHGTSGGLRLRERRVFTSWPGGSAPAVSSSFSPSLCIYLLRVRLFLCSFVLYRSWIPREHRRGIRAVECVTAYFCGFEEDSRSGVVFWIDELSIEFGCLFFICRGTCAVECVAAHLRGSEEDSRSEVVFWIVLPFSSS